VKDDDKAVSEKARAFMLAVPVKEGVRFNGWIKGENLSAEIIGAIKEVQDMSERGFVQFGGYKTRGMGAIKIEIEKLEKYKTLPFGLDKSYEGEELGEFLDSVKSRTKNYYNPRRRNEILSYSFLWDNNITLAHWDKEVWGLSLYR